MAAVLLHPDVNSSPHEITIASGAGIVTVSVKKGEVLTVERANFLLDRAKHELMESSHETH